MLMELLEVEWDWCIYRLSDGQRRRVQLLLGLAKKKELLLLDEVTTDLDVVARQNLLNFLKEESEQVFRMSRVCVRGRSGFRVVPGCASLLHVCLRMSVCAHVSACVSLCGVTLIYGTHIFEGYENCLNAKP
jgi:ABC-type phosphonate transport system ATPase subunit